MIDRARLEQALIAADKAGDTAAARKLASALRSTAAPQPEAPASTHPAEPIREGKPVGDLASTILDPVGAVGSSALATPIAGIAGLGAAGTKAVGLTTADPGDVVRRVQSALTYEPQTVAGEYATKAVSYPFEKLAEFGDFLGQKASNATGSPAFGAAINTATQFAPAALLKGVSRLKSPATLPEPVPQQAPSLPQVTAQEPGYVAPDLVLQQEVRNNPQPAKVQQTTPEARAKEYVTRTVGVDWNALPVQVQGTLTRIASAANGLDKLDPAAVRRQVQLESLPKPVPATRGQLTRDPVELRNESNVSATEAGKPIRETHLEANQALLDNLDLLKGRVANKRGGAQTPEQVGISVQDQALRAKLELSKKGVKAKYTAAEAAGELQGKVSPTPILKAIGASPDKTHFSWVQSWLNEMEVVKKTEGGTVVKKLTLKELEDLRQAAVARAMNGGTEGYYAGKIIAAIDQATEGGGGKFYKEARAARRAQATEFEETGAIARLVENKSRTDRATALEDTWRKTVLGGSIQDLRNVKRSLLTGGDAKTRSAGKTAWRDIKAQTIQHIKDEATKSVATNERGAPNITPAAMKRAIDSVGKDKLNEIFGEGTAQRLDAILEATRTVKTVPPPLHAGSSTMGNILAFLEKGLGKIPLVGDIGTGAIRAGVKLKEMGASSRVVRESQNTPLRPRRNALADMPRDF